MRPIIVRSKDLKLPETVARKLRGREIEIRETREGILLKSVRSPILSARGMLKGKGFTTKEFARLKAEEKELER